MRAMKEGRGMLGERQRKEREEGVFFFFLIKGREKISLWENKKLYIIFSN